MLASSAGVRTTPALRRKWIESAGEAKAGDGNEQHYDYGCRAAGDKLRGSLNNIPIHILKLYVQAKIDGIKEYNNDREQFINSNKNSYPYIYYVGHRERMWLEYFKGKDEDLDRLIDELTMQC
ncbi:hypothetical protein SAMN05446037_1001184 [Anaerovirgula multivorans]|uniref:Uncharacterized protein n=1 Tax=Anaerovirgula multivorans TaxID=312168 RepID=A0A238ZWH1_9FIRM|nr:hypothetical protein SAMN05446037_1001184 [Anaerovirgula multivorans]